MHKMRNLFEDKILMHKNLNLFEARIPREARELELGGEFG